MTIQPEFSRKISLSQIQNKQITLAVTASEKECENLAKRFRLPAIIKLECFYEFSPISKGEIKVKGELDAKILQNCVLTLEDFPAELHNRFDLILVPVEKITEEIEEINEPDLIPYEGNSIDLGEVTAEQLALSLDAYPRQKNASNPEIFQEDKFQQVEPISSTENPFLVLAQLKESMKRDKH